MNSLKNAGATFEGRKLLIDRIAVMGLTPAAEGLLDRSSSPLMVHNGLDETLCQRMEQVRRSRMHMRRRAYIVGRSVATVKKQAPSALGYKLPASRLGGNNLLQLDIQRLKRSAHTRNCWPPIKEAEGPRAATAWGKPARAEGVS